MKKLSATLYKEFQDALISAFPSFDTFEQMVRYQMSENLIAIAGDGVLNTVVFNLIKWAEANGQLDKLIEGARISNPGNRDLLVFEKNYKESVDISHNINLPITQVTLASLPLRPAFAHAQSQEMHWADRKKELQSLIDFWNDGTCKVVGIIGWGGVGKSTLARRWYDELYKLDKTPDGFFWWSFYYQPSLDNFLEAALLYFTEGNFRSTDTPSPWMRTQQFIKLLLHGRFAVVLDGLEVMQDIQNTSDYFGRMQDKAFRNLLELCADTSTHNSFILATSRFPLTDLQPFINHSYVSISLDSFSEKDGAEYLRKRGIKGSQVELEEISKEYGGHALSLSTLTGYLNEYFDGDAQAISQIPYLATAEKTKINQILVAYNDRLTDAQRAAMLLISACRRPPSEKMLIAIIQSGKTAQDQHPVLKPFIELDTFSLKNLLVNLEKRGLIYRERNHLGEWGYNAHLMIREFFNKQLFPDPDLTKNINLLLRQFWESKTLPEQPDNLDDWIPLFDTIYYSCRAGLYDDGIGFYRKRLAQWQFASQFGAYEFQIALLREFFPERNIFNPPILANSQDRSFILNEVGYCLDKIGRTVDVALLGKRTAEQALKEKDYLGAAITYQGLSGALDKLGRLADAKTAAYEALELARVSESKLYECNSLARLGWITFISGEIENAEIYYQQANSITWSENPEELGLFSILGVEYSTFLLMTDRLSQGLAHAKKNLAICQNKKWRESIAHCHRILGDIEFMGKNYSTAVQHFLVSLEISQQLGLQDALALSLLGSARVEFFKGEIDAVNEKLVLAQKICLDAEYRIIHADILNFWAEVDLFQEKFDDAIDKSKAALALAEKSGYIGAKATALNTLGQLIFLSGDHQEGIKNLKEASQIRERIRDPRAASTIQLLNTLTQVATE